MLNAVTMMYNEADELTACHFIRPSTYWKRREAGEKEPEASPDNLDTPPVEESPPSDVEAIDQNEPS